MHFDSLSAREWKDPKTTRPHILPIYATSSFDFEDIEHSMRVFGNQEVAHTYSRYGNPTVDATAAKIAAMETFETDMEALAIMTNSGMAAIDMLIGGLLKSGDKILTQHTLYGGTTELLMKIVTRTGIEIVMTDLSDPEKVDAYLQKDPSIRLVYFETPANPTLAVIDISVLTEVAQKHNRWTAIDNTFATPYLQQPFKHGVDFIIHSTTKYLNGHGTGMAGVVIGKDIQIMKEKIWTQMKLTGANCSPFEAWLVYQGLKTLPLRMHKHCANALFLAYKLSEHPNVSYVNYPGLETNENYTIARKQMSAFGGMMSFELKGDIQNAIKAMNNFKLCSLAPTLGDVDTLILHPASSSHIKVDPELRRKAGVTDGLIRVSVGIENPQDLLEDILQAIE